MKEKSTLEQVRENDSKIDKLVIWHFEHKHFLALKDNAYVTDILIVARFPDTSIMSRLKGLLQENIYVEKISFLDSMVKMISDDRDWPIRFLYRDEVEKCDGVFTQSEMDLSEYAQFFQTRNEINILLRENEALRLQLKKLEQEKETLKEYKVESANFPNRLPLPLLQALGQVKSLRKVTATGTMDNRSTQTCIKAWQQLLDLNIGIVEVEIEDVRFWQPWLHIGVLLKRNQCVAACKASQPNEIIVELANADELLKFLEHDGCYSVISNVQRALKFRLDVAEASLFESRKFLELSKNNNIQFIAYRYELKNAPEIRKENPLSFGLNSAKEVHYTRERKEGVLKKGLELFKNLCSISTDPCDRIYREYSYYCDVPVLKMKFDTRDAKNKLSDGDFKIIVDLIKSNASINEFILMAAAISDERLYQLSDAIKTNTKIVKIDLSRNNFSLTAVKYFFEVVAQNKYITDIAMKGVAIPGRRLKEIAKILECNQSLLRFDIKPSIPENQQWIQAKKRSDVEVGYFPKDLEAIVDLIDGNKYHQEEAVNFIRSQNNQKLENLLRRGVSPNARDVNGKTLLHHAASSGDADIFTFLIQQGASVDLRDNENKTCIECCEDEKKKVQFLAIVNGARQSKAKEALYAKVSGEKQEKKKPRSNDMLSIELYSNHVKTLSNTSQDRMIPESVLRFQTACQNGDLKKVESILNEIKSETDRVNLVNARSAYGKTSAHIAAYEGHVELLYFLIKNKADLSATDHARRLVLHEGALCRKANKIEDILRCLVDQDTAGVNKSDSYGLTPLYILAGGFEANPSQTDQFRAGGVRLLLAKGANPNVIVKDVHLSRNISVLHKAIYNGFYYVMKAMIISPKTDINILDSNGSSSLHYAVTCQHTQRMSIVGRLLIEPDINVDISNQDKQTPLALLKKAQPTSDVVKLEKLFEARKLRRIPNYRHTSILWSSSLKLLFGSKQKNELVIDVSDAHQSLRNSVRESGNKYGNSVSARLTFIVSSTKYGKDGQHQRISVPIKLVFAEKIHATTMWESEKIVNSKDDTSFFNKPKRRSPDALDRILRRHREAPEYLKHKCVNELTRENKKPFSSNVIEKAFMSTDKEFGAVFERSFHHSEQALFDHLEQSKTLSRIVDSLEKQQQVKTGAKVYAIILSIHSTRYICVNCEVSTLGEHRILSENLGDILEKRGYSLPKDGIKVVTTVTADLEGQRVRRAKVDHCNYSIDLRGARGNGLIVSQDTRVMKNEDTMYLSNKRYTPNKN